MNEPDVTIHDATPGDLPAMMAILNAEIASGTNAFDTEPIPDTEHAAWLAAHPPDRHPAIVAHDGKRLLGWACLSPWARHGGYRRTVEASLWLEPAARGRGLGRRLYETLLARARAIGHRVVIARVTAGNTASLRLHQRLGFRHVGTMRGVGEKFGQTLDVALFEMHLQPADAPVPGPDGGGTPEERQSAAELIYYVASSADGRIAPPGGGVEWLAPFGAAGEDYGYEAFYRTVDALLMGRRTYEQVIGFGDWPYAGKPCWVCSRRPLEAPPPGVVASDRPPVEVVAQMEAAGHRRIWLVGGGTLAGALHAAGRIDRYVLSIVPVLLGDGVPLLGGHPAPAGLEFLDSRAFDTGIVQAHYRRASPP